jgi:CheY-like chemotaxis protein
VTVADNSTVFVVDDDAGVRASIEGLLKSVGLRSTSFATAKEFLDRRGIDGPSCLVLDVRLPGVSGLDFQRKLKEAGVGGESGSNFCVARLADEITPISWTPRAEQSAVSSSHMRFDQLLIG